VENDFAEDPHCIVPADEMAPVAGFSHVTVSERALDIDLRFTVKVPPLGAYTTYSAPTEGVCARQYPVEESEPIGVAFFRLSFVTQVAIQPKLSRRLSQLLAEFAPLQSTGVPFGVVVQEPLLPVVVPTPFTTVPGEFRLDQLIS
jgi:hypothetical protein